jgi:uncharacterized protein YdhG (YjbR/CyaY superfamily)
MKKPKDIDEYIKDFPKETKTVLRQIRAAIRKASPKAVEVISYGMPAFKLNEKVLIYFAGFKNHIGLYPAPRAKEEFKKELAAYKGGKGTVQFPLDKPMPLNLITRIVKFKVNEILQTTKTKKK